MMVSEWLVMHTDGLHLQIDRTRPDCSGHVELLHD